MHTLTEQAIFDRVVDHFLAMSEPSRELEKDSVCLYRTADGNRCFVGALIRDEHYDPSIEGAVVLDDSYALRDDLKLALLKSFADDYGYEGCELPDAICELMDELQCIHDDWIGDRSLVEAALRTLAEERVLSAGKLADKITA